MARVLRDLGGVEETDLVLLVDDPNAHDVRAALKSLEKRIREHRSDGGDAALLLYYSGHANEAELELTETGFDLRVLRKWMRKSHANLRLAVLDACHSGAAVRDKGGVRTRKQPVAFNIDDALGAEGYAILTSSARGEESQESDEIRGSFFTHHLVSGLRGAADNDRNGSVTLGEAYRYAYARTLEHTASKARVAQHPTVDIVFKGGSDVVLTTLAGSTARVRLAAKGEDARWILYSPRAGQVLAELDERQTTDVSVAVPPGPIDVYRRSKDRVTHGTISAIAGNEVVLDTGILEEVSLSSYMRKGEDTGVTLAALVGVQTFGAEDVRSELVGPMPYFSLAIGLTDLGRITGLDLRFDLGVASMAQRVTLEGANVRQTLTQFQAGIALPYRFDIDKLAVSVGPRVAYVLLHRDLESVSDGTQNMSTLSLGGVVGTHWRFGQRFSIGMTAQISYIPMFNDVVERDQWVVETQASAVYHF
jgi:hypothetical protein